MGFKKFFIIASLLFINKFVPAAVLQDEADFLICLDTNFTSEEITGTEIVENGGDKRPNPIFQLLRARQKKKKQVVAALLAFPLPFGIVGLHRIYLGCAPYVPVAYIASLGGMFGVLPFIDFCVILLNKDTDRYVDSSKIFMWVN